jgi:hypothetical protein
MRRTGGLNIMYKDKCLFSVEKKDLSNLSEKGNKLHDQNFIYQIKDFDIVLLSETHVGYETTVDVENFFYYPKRK